MADIITQSANAVVMLGLAGDKSHLLFARTENAPGEMNQLLKQALQLLDGAGGGSPAMAQGGGKAADVAQVDQAIQRARRILRGQVK
jgi:alanyl-tRNA synthetase